MDRNRTGKRRKVKRKGFCGLKKTNDINTGDVQPEMGENSSDIHAEVGDALGQNVGVKVEVPHKPSTDVEGGTSNTLSAMERKLGDGLQTVKNLTRKRKRDSALLFEDIITPVCGYKIIDSSILQGVVDSISKCPSCGVEKQLQLKQNNEKKSGMCETVIIL